MTIRWVLLLLLPVSTAFAGQTLEVEPGGTYQVRAAANDLTSIGMADNLRLQAVFGMESLVTISKDEAFGRVIIKPVSGQAFTLIVTDENGDSYSLEVSPVAGPGEVITLKRKSHRMNEALLKAERDLPFTSRLKRTLKQVAQGQVPAGYELKRRDVTVPLWVEAEFRLVAVYRGAMTIEHYVLQNVSGSDMRLDEREFRGLGSVRSVAIRRHHLPPDAQTDVYIVRDPGVGDAGRLRGGSRERT
ncbi:MAG TPA: type-F conjugative transfer system secretin TraK [Woeseiaceae bacterium]|nr:type-F conjugative transfer system secretin TraK [Woeseiaceae bacterium]